MESWVRPSVYCTCGDHKTLIKNLIASRPLGRLLFLSDKTTCLVFHPLVRLLGLMWFMGLLVVTKLNACPVLQLTDSPGLREDRFIRDGTRARVYKHKQLLGFYVREWQGWCMPDSKCILCPAYLAIKHDLRYLFVRLRYWGVIRAGIAELTSHMWPISASTSHLAL